MSQATKKALYSTLSGDSILATMLGDDEKGAAAVFNTTFNQLTQVSGWSYPAVTFREAAGSADLRFGHDTVDREIWEIEVWADPDDESGLTIPAIFERIDSLLHNQVLSLASGENYDCVRMALTPDIYDEKRKQHYGLASYRLISIR